MIQKVLINVENVKKAYPKQQALRGVTFAMNESDEYIITGASGSGKSTLLYMLGGLEKPTEGKVEVNGEDLSKMDDEALAIYRNQYVGFVFQFHFLLSSMTCLDNILLPAKLGNGLTKEVRERADQLIKLLKVEHCANKFPFELSGGEQQRINIIRALLLRPKLLLCDEPTGNLDSENSEKVIELLRSLARDFGATLIVVTHDMNIASRFRNRFVMKDGLIQRL